MSTEFKIEGLDEVTRKLQTLGSQKVAKRIARKASRQAMNLVRDAARINAKAIDDPETAEKIFKNIVTQGGKSRNANEVVMRVGVRGGASQNKHSVSTAGLSGGDTRHWRYKEYPTSKTVATPFMRPALANNIQQVTNKFVQVFDTELDKELAKL